MVSIGKNKPSLSELAKKNLETKKAINDKNNEITQLDVKKSNLKSQIADVINGADCDDAKAEAQKKYDIENENLDTQMKDLNEEMDKLQDELDKYEEKMEEAKKVV